MVCIYCGGETGVINSRPQRRSNQVWRRRRCILCVTVFSTQEVVDYRKSIRVRQPTKRQLEPFSRDRLLLSLYKSLAHRPDAIDDAAALCTTIIQKLLPTADNSVLRSEQIVQTTVVALNRFDTLAASHYQALHRP